MSCRETSRPIFGEPIRGQIDCPWSTMDGVCDVALNVRELCLAIQGALVQNPSSVSVIKPDVVILEDLTKHKFTPPEISTQSDRGTYVEGASKQFHGLANTLNVADV